MINFLDGSTQDCGISNKLVMDITVLHKAFDTVPSSYNMINFLDGSVHNCSNGVSEWWSLTAFLRHGISSSM